MSVEVGMKKVFPKIIILVLIILAGYYIWNSYHKNKNNDYITLYGNVDIRQVNLSFRVSGRIGKMLFEEGDVVKKGQIVAILDQQPFLEDVSMAKGQLESAEANFSKLKSGNRPQEIETARALVKERQAAYNNALTLYQRQSAAVNTGAVSRQDLSNTEALKNETAEQLSSAKEQLNLTTEGFRKEDISGAKAQVDVAKASLDSANTRLNDTKIISPSNGIILTRIQEPGAIVSAGSPVYSLSLTSPVWVRAYVSEEDLGKIYPGMKAQVYTDAQPDKPYSAQIGFISPVAEFTPKSVETTELRSDLVYRLRIIIKNPDQNLRQGMPVTVKLKLAETKDEK